MEEKGGKEKEGEVLLTKTSTPPQQERVTRRQVIGAIRIKPALGVEGVRVLEVPFAARGDPGVAAHKRLSTISCDPKRDDRQDLHPPESAPHQPSPLPRARLSDSQMESAAQAS